jgi:hypothetical protein
MCVENLLQRDEKQRILLDRQRAAQERAKLEKEIKEREVRGTCL